MATPIMRVMIFTVLVDTSLVLNISIDLCLVIEKMIFLKELFKKCLKWS